MSIKNAKKLFVFQTSRKLSKFLSQNQNTFLSALTLSEFIDRAALSDGRAKISKSARIALLKKAVDRVDVGALGFEKSFLEFVSGSDFLFSFFEELCAEQKSIDDIRGEDLYAAFEDHLGALERVYEAYKEELEKIGAYDFITLGEWRVNGGYLSSFEEVVVESMGLFSAFELTVLERVSQIIPVKLVFTIDRYNKKMAQKFEAFGIDTGGAEGELHIDLSAKKLLKASKKEPKTGGVEAYRLKNRAYGAPFAFSQLSRLLREGAKPENIAIILADEGFAPLLKLFDKHSNLNFAFGEPFSKTKIFNAFSVLLSFARGGAEGRAIEAMGIEELMYLFEPLLVCDGVLELKERVLKFLEFEAWRESDREVFRKALYELLCEQAAFEGMPSIEIAHIFLSSLAQIKIDDANGGKIRVIGALESRGIELDGAIVLDMNEEFFPKVLDKDLFLNTKIKEKAKIPTIEDRRNLQKHFFLELIANTKKCIFAFTENDEASPSPFLRELCAEFIDVDESSLERLYLGQKTREKKSPKLFCDSKNLYEAYKEAANKEALSVSAFCDFLKCDRLFFFKYIKKLKKESIERKDESAKDIGSALHKALETVFKNGDETTLKTADALKEALLKEVKSVADGDLCDSFEFLFRFQKMERFFEVEADRHSDGWRVFCVEKELRGDIGGVIFDARVDRIDKKGSEYALIDYKISSKQIKADSAKSSENSSRYQLCIYKNLLEKEGTNILAAYYYDVLEGSLVKEEEMGVKEGFLRDHIDRFLQKPLFLGAKEKSSCVYCDFSTLCGY